MKNLIKLMTTCSLLMTNIISTLSNANHNTSNFQNNFYTLGDSLSDVGTLVGAGSQFFQNIPLPEELMKSHDVQLKLPYYQNRSWCNGPVVTELISKKLKQKVTAGWDFIALNGQHFSQIGTNYAVGGTFIEKVYGLEGLFLNKFSLDEQIKSLIKQHSDFYNDDLVFINIGTNDLMWIIDHNITDIDNAINKIINKLDEDLTELINKNIKKIVITNIADMGLIPNYKETINQQPMTNLVNKFNLKLTEEIKKANKNFEKTNIKEYDVFSKFNKLFEQFKNRGSQYQDSNATKIDINTLGKNGILQPQYVSGANSQNIDNYFFLDQFHPTKWVQEQIANDLYKFNNKNLFEVDYRPVAHDWIKVKISYDNFLHIQNIYNTEKQENFKQLFFKIINKFAKEDDTELGGSISQDDIYTTIKVIIDHFQEINNFFKRLPEDQGIRLVTNRIGSWDKNDSMGVFSQ